MKIALKDKTEAQVSASLTIDGSGNMTLTAQKQLKDDDTGEVVNDGDPVATNLNADQAAAIEAALVPIVTGIITPNAAGTGTNTGAGN